MADCAVIQTYDAMGEEYPKAYVVKAMSVTREEDEEQLILEIQRHVEKAKSRHKWLKGGVEFIQTIPKSPSGKILRRMLRDKDRDDRREHGAKL